MKKYLFPFSLLLLVMLLAAWGSKGHRIVSQNAPFCLPGAMGFLQPAWTNFVTSHASDADYRKNQDPDESARHYIDIDNYPEFILSGLINHSYDSVVAGHGLSFVISQGILPWATLRSYDSLKSCFQRGDWNRSALFAADLGHYVADGHMPLHITRNYNGQYTGQLDIHSRFETAMVKRYEGLLVYPADSAVVVADAGSYIFGYLYANYPYVDSVLLADTYATQAAGSIGTDSYYQALWARSGPFTIRLMERGSHALASLILTAWKEAGSPRMYPNAIDDPSAPGQASLMPVYPDPAGEIVCFPVTVSDNHSPFTIEIYDMAGNLRETILTQPADEGVHKVMWDTGSVPGGTYLCVLKSGSYHATRKFVILH